MAKKPVGEDMAFAREDLTEAERRAWDSVEAGEAVDFSDGPERLPDDPASSDAERTIRAEVIVQLATGDLETKRLSLVAARIINALNVEGLVLANQLQFRACWFEEPLNLSDAQIPSLELIACEFPALRASRLVVGSLALNDSSCGRIDLSRAHIRREPSFPEVTLARGADIALNADRVSVNGATYCDGLIAEGTRAAVSLTSAQFQGELIFAGATLRSNAGIALNARRVSVNGATYCDGLTAEGARAAVSLVASRFNGLLSFAGATVTSSAGVALNAEGVSVNGATHCDGLTAEGARAAVSLSNAEFDGLLSFAGATVTSSAGIALNVNQVMVDGSLSLNQLTARPRIRLSELRVTESLSVDDAIVVTSKGASVNLDIRQLQASLLPQPTVTDESKPSQAGRFGIVGFLAAGMLPFLPFFLVVVLVISLIQAGIHPQPGVTFISETAAIIWFSLFTGLCSMVVIEVAKRLLGFRGIYQSRQVRVWLMSRAPNEKDGSSAYDRLVEILGGLPGSASWRGTSYVAYLRRLFDLPIEQLSAQIRLAADAVIVNPWRDKALIAAFAGRNVVLAAEKDALGTEGPAFDEVEVVQFINGGIDALQITVGEGWRRYIRTIAAIVSGALGVAFLKLVPVHYVSSELYILASLVLGGFFAWFLRDLAAVVEKLRR